MRGLGHIPQKPYSASWQSMSSQFPSQERRVSIAVPQTPPIHPDEPYIKSEGMDDTTMRGVGPSPLAKPADKTNRWLLNDFLATRKAEGGGAPRIACS
jgi:hypothetical protein